MTSVAHIIRRRRARQARLRARASRQRAVTIGIFIILTFFVVLPTVGAAGFALLTYNDLVRDLPQPEQTIFIDPIVGPTELYDRTGDTLLWSMQDPLGDERAWVPLGEMPSYVLQATLLAEDPDYLQTAAFRPWATAEKLTAYALGRNVRPDPTLTGRLVRQLFANTDRARELALVAEVDRRYSPQEVLEWHLNTNYYGNDAYGIAAAAQVYLGKRAEDLTLDEATLLAAIPTAPQYNPLDDVVAARGRRNDLLRELLRAGHIDETAFEAATTTETQISTEFEVLSPIAPSFSLYAREQAEQILDLSGLDGARLVSRGGLRITTTLDLELYEQADCALATHLARLRNDPAPTGNCPAAALLPEVEPLTAAAPDSGALVLIDVATGELRAAIGNIESAAYQPGPVLFPFVYFDGFSSVEFTPASMLLDIPLRFPGPADGLIYTPNNPDGSFRGPVSIREALGAGLLPPTVDVANVRGMENVIRVAHRMGINSLYDERYDLSLLERGGVISVLDTAYAYSVFAAQGDMRGLSVPQRERDSRIRDPLAVLRIEDSDGNILWNAASANSGVGETPIFLPGLGFLLNNILSDPTTRSGGIDSPLELGRPSAVVNGLVGDSEESWTVGYTPDMVSAVWVGREDGAPTALDTYGLAGAGPVWRAVMTYAHQRAGLPPRSWEQPPDVIEGPVCERSGLRPNGVCPVRAEFFLENTQPPEQDTYWQQYEINTQTNQLATANTPAGFREVRNFFVPPGEAREWWLANGLPLPPSDYDTITRPTLVSSTVILQPELLDYVTGTVDVQGTLDPTNLQYYQLAYGQGLNPSAWVDITGQRTSFSPGESLAQWDTSDLDGLYNLRLTVVYEDGSIDPYITQVTVDNTPPDQTH